MPALGVDPENSPCSIWACAAEVSWYSSSSTTRNWSRNDCDTSGTSRANCAATAIWSANSTTPRRRFNAA